MQISFVQFFADFQNSVSVNSESVIVKRDLVNAVFVVDKLHFVNDVFGAAHTVTSSEHPHGAAEVTPVHASAAADQREQDFAVVL
jgi:hypothetical protein